MVKKYTLCIGLALLSFSATAQNNGATNGLPFQDVQTILSAASDALAAAVSANTANIEANTAAIDAEESARLAMDAMLAAQFAADLALEAAARISGDLALADAIAAEELARIQGMDLLGSRIDALEAGSGGALPYNEISYEETSGFDFTDFRTDVNNLPYQPGEWLYIESTYAPTGETSAVCTSHPAAFDALLAIAFGGSGSFPLNGSMTYVLQEGSNSWANASASMFIMPGFMRVSGLQMYTQIFDRSSYGNFPEEELTTVSGSAVGSTVVIRTAVEKLDACGF